MITGEFCVAIYFIASIDTRDEVQQLVNNTYYHKISIDLGELSFPVWSVLAILDTCSDLSALHLFLCSDWSVA
jgi:hypothetical protein